LPVLHRSLKRIEYSFFLIWYRVPENKWYDTSEVTREAKPPPEMRAIYLLSRNNCTDVLSVLQTLYVEKPAKIQAISIG
jgi:hypothetical protein